MLCVLRAEVAFCVDRWQRQYRCYSHGELTFLAPWYEKQQQEFADECEKITQDAGDPEVTKPETRNKLRDIIEKNEPWNACEEHDLILLPLQLNGKSDD